jgi:hypothetical protein
VYVVRILAEQIQAIHIKDQNFYDIQELQGVVQNITDLITTFFGGLTIIFEGIQSRPSSQDLISEGWGILFQELKDKLFLPYNDITALPSERIHKRDLLEYLSQPRNDCTIPPDLIIKLINIWAQRTFYSPHSFGINLREFKFANTIFYNECRSMGVTDLLKYFFPPKVRFPLRIIDFPSTLFIRLSISSFLFFHLGPFVQMPLV